MFNRECKTCKKLEEEVAYLRALVNRLMYPIVPTLPKEQVTEETPVKINPDQEVFGEGS